MTSRPSPGAPFDPTLLSFQPNEAIWVAIWRPPGSDLDLEVTVDGSPDCPDPDLLALLTAATANRALLGFDARRLQQLFAPWHACHENVPDWTLEGIHVGHCQLYRKAIPVTWLWFLNGVDTYGCYHAGFSGAALAGWPVAVSRVFW